MDWQQHETGRTLRKAAQLIETRGWVQGWYGTDRDGFCISGAIRNVAGNDWISESVATEFFRWLTEAGAIDKNQYSVPAWNDAPERTQEDVILYLNKCADEFDLGPAL